MSKIQDDISVNFNFKKEINKEEEVKPKAKRASKKIIVEDIKPVEPVEPIEDIKPVVEIEDIEEIPKNIKTLEQVECDKCNKKMTKNTLRYHHDKNCKGKPIDTKALPVKRRIKKDEQKVEPNIEPKQPTYRDKLNERFKQKSEKIAKLALQIA